MGCSDLGISVSNSSSSSPPPPASNEDSKNEASSILQGSSLWLVLVHIVFFYANGAQLKFFLKV
ncbi:hypothetical protein TSUD_13770 [Trifolium subterraneum]|uniref:Uncharacterized protein n=1 Tax=Trifolium subterraneum TaxID=3900 RepID=A0A2Z6NZS7_TRISU|nr:hypothetical protein TSUD_13770 [Trifolium subterraneum]